MAEVVFLILCEQCLLKLPDPVDRDLAIKECGGFKDQNTCPRCGPVDRVRLLPTVRPVAIHDSAGR